MKTLITMQRLGCKNHPKWRFIVRGQKKSMKGRYIEELGLWIPQKRRTVQRSLIFNKPRILYWLAMGATPTHRMQIFLSYIGFMPNRIDYYGNISKYQEQKELHRTYDVWQEKQPKLRKFKTNLQIQQSKQEEDNKIYREHLMISQKIYGDNYDKMINVQTAAESIQEQEQKRVKEGLEEIPYEVNDRTKQFYQLRELLDRCDRDKNREADLEVINDRLNRLCEKGIMDQKYYTEYVMKEVDEDMKIELLSGEQQHRYLRRKRLEQILIQRKQMQEYNLELMSPLSESQAGQFMIQQLDFDPEQAMDITYELFKAAEVTHTLPTKQDIMELVDQVDQSDINSSEWNDIRYIFNKVNDELEQGKGYIPVVKTIHHFPELSIYDPEEYYDYDQHNRGIEDDYMQRLNYDRAYTCDGIAEIVTQQNSSHSKIRTRSTYQKRIMKRKKYYSTVQTVSMANSNHYYHMNMLQEIRYTLNGL